MKLKGHNILDFEFSVEREAFRLKAMVTFERSEGLYDVFCS